MSRRSRRAMIARFLTKAHALPNKSTPIQIQTWLNGNLGIVRHALEDGSFSESGYSRKDWERLYAPPVEYHDLFIVAHGRSATWYSLQIIAQFWKIRLPHDFGRNWRLVLPEDCEAAPKTTTTTSPATTIVRIPFRVHQQLKLAPSLVQTHCDGWLDLHLQPQKIAVGDQTSDFVIVRHDDRMVWPSASRNNTTTTDVLSKIRAIPVLGWGWEALRHAHGRVVEYFAPP